MNVREVKRESARLSPSERSDLESFLRAKRVAERPEFRERVAAARRRMDAGEMVTTVQLRALLRAHSPAVG